VHARNLQGAARPVFVATSCPSAFRSTTLVSTSSAPFSVDGVVDDTGVAVEVGHNRHVGDVRRTCRVQPDCPVNSRIVEEVVPVDLTLSGRRVLDDAWWDGLEAQRVVDHSGDPDLFAAGDVLGDVGLKGVYPPSCETTSLLLTHTVARWVADSKWSTMRRPCQPRGTQTLVLYQTSPK